MSDYRAVFVDANNDPTYGKFPQRGITVPYLDLRESRLTAAYLDNVRAQPGITGCGVYADPTWWPQDAPASFAARVDARLRAIGWQGNATVCLDIETHDVAFVLAALAAWRRLRPTRPTWWTFEGFQGGLFDAAAVEAIIASGVRLAPQFYTGNMTPLEHSPVIDLLMAGFPGERIDGMYDAARLPYRWRGFAFTQGRLP